MTSPAVHIRLIEDLIIGDNVKVISFALLDELTIWLKQALEAWQNNKE
jgi:hypothetical protein